MTRNVTCLSCLLVCQLLLAGCASFIDATTDEPIQIDAGKRSFGEYVDDRRLRTVIKVNIKKADPQLDKANIDVHSFNAVVLLTGEVPTKELRELAGETARNVNKVRQVYNELKIAPNTKFPSRANDTWIKSRIKSKLFFNRDIESDRVEVIVEDNTVYLMGLMSEMQANKITEVVRTTPGVNKVVRAVEYIE